MPNKPHTQKDKDAQHINVVVRCRPLSNNEKKKGCFNVVDSSPQTKEIHVRERLGNISNTKTFHFDKVFGPNAKQIEVYKTVVVPILDEVVMGYNCTVFAYGQTGTGKTFTMEGERSQENGYSWESDPLAGIIPRAMHQLFSRLTAMGGEFSVKVSYLEIYNEELIDLLGAESVENPRLKIYEDTSKKGSCVIHGLEEVSVHSREEVFHILERGAQRRQTAATLLNAHSSRSHCLFMVTVHIKENNMDGEELLKTGKLNLVDLAGSENIGRSGAIEKRAREAGNINQSLLTLGRVITALVEHAPHIPYRESKLTRLLQDSLGGRTKTSLIATISPASGNIEETLSTLDYAFRAKNITNKPEINQKLTKKALMKDFTEEIERLRKDLQAARDKSGFFIAQENYDDMMTDIRQKEDSIHELEERIKQLNMEHLKITDLFQETTEELHETRKVLDDTAKELETTKVDLRGTKINLSRTTRDRDEHKFLLGEHMKTEDKLHDEASQLLTTANDSTKDVHGLHSKLDRVRDVTIANDQQKENFQASFNTSLKDVKDSVAKHHSCMEADHEQLRSDLQTWLAGRCSDVTDLNKNLESISTCVSNGLKEMHDNDQKFLDDHAVDSEDCAALRRRQWAEEKERQGEFLDKQLRSEVSQLQRRIDCINSQLYGFSKTVASHSERQQQALTDFVDQHKRELEALETKVSGSFEQLKTEIIELKQLTSGTLKENEQLSEKIHNETKQAMLAALEAGAAQHRSKLQKDAESAQKSLSKCTDNITVESEKHKTFIREEIRALAADAEELQSSEKKETAEKEKMVKEMVEVNKGECRGVERLKEDAENYFKEHCKRAERYVEELEQRLLAKKEKLTSGLEQRREMNNALQIKTKNSSDSLINSVSAGLDHYQSAVEAQRDVIAQRMKSVTSWSGDITADLNRMGKDTEVFLKQRLRNVQPTGETPQRREFQYPSTLSQTDAHSPMLKTFRRQYTYDEAVHNPLPPLDDTFEGRPEGALHMEELDEVSSQDGAHLDESGRSRISSDSAMSTASFSSSQAEVKDPESICGGKHSSTKENSMPPPRGAVHKSKMALPSRDRSRSNSRTRKLTTDSSKTPTKSITPRKQLPKAALKAVENCR